MRREFSDAPVEGVLATAWNQAVEFMLRTLAELAEPAEIGIAARFDQKDVQLMIGDADPGSRLKCLAQGKRGGGAVH